MQRYLGLGVGHIQPLDFPREDHAVLTLPEQVYTRSIVQHSAEAGTLETEIIMADTIVDLLDDDDRNHSDGECPGSELGFYL